MLIAMSMTYRRLGTSGLKVSALSFGAWVTFGKQVGDPVAEQLMTTAYDAGVNFFDNAETYADGQAERVMGAILKKSGWPRDTFLVSSKVFFGAEREGPNQIGLSRKHVVEACHAALQRLQVDYLDLYYCHRPDPETPIEETARAMHDLITQGKVLYWGTSEWSAEAILEAHRVAKSLNLIGPAVEQPQYNLFERQKVEHEFLPVFAEVGIGTTIWSPLASGLLTGKYNKGIPEGSRLALESYGWLKDRMMQDDKIEKVKKLEKVSKELGTTTGTLAIAWCIHNPNVTTAILGATKEAQLLENLKAIEVLAKLTPEVMNEIEGIMG